MKPAQSQGWLELQQRIAGVLSRLPPTFYRYIPYGLVFVCLLSVLLFGDKFWDANDDEHMAMIAQGYGLSSTPSAILVYSNVVWGWLVMALGSPFGIPGYTVGAYGAMLASATAIAWVMLKRGVPGLLAAAILLAMFVRPFLEPQFSITAGYAAVAGMALLVTCEHVPRWSVAGAGALFLVLAGLLRFRELVFVGLVGSPYLLCVMYRNRQAPTVRPILAALLMSCVLLGGCWLADAHGRAGPEWRRFDTMNAMRRPFTDYGLAGYFLGRPQRMHDAGLSSNDMHLLVNWFFLDPGVFNDKSLGGLRASLPAADRVAYNLRSYKSLIRPFSAPLVALLSAVAVLALAVSGRRRVALCAVALFGLAMFIFLCMGRPGVPRIFPGAVAAIALLTMLDAAYVRRLWVTLAGGLLLCLVCADGTSFFKVHAVQGVVAAAVKRAVCLLPDRDQLQIVWGAPRGFPDRYVFNPTQSPTDACLPHMYQIGVLELLPANLQNLHAVTQGRDLIPALLSGQHLEFLTTPGHLDLLDQFLQEHYATRLHREASYDKDGIQQFKVWAEAMGHALP